jgi:formylglycine-generating enzyme required for sulfatase activity
MAKVKVAGCLLTVALVTSGDARGDTAPLHLLAVLPLTAPKLDKDLRETLEEDIRTVAGNALSSRGYTVLTGETTLTLLADNAVDSNKVCEASCALNAAREMKATLFISGTATQAEGEYIAFVRLFESPSGRQLASVKLEGARVKELREQFESRASDLFASVTGPGGAGPVLPAAEVTPPPAVEPSGPRVKKSAVTASVGTLTISAKPKGAVRLDIVDPDGRKSASGGSYENKQAKPGTWHVTAQATGYEGESQAVEVPADDVALARFDLKPLGSLKIVGTPSGAAVHVSGPDGFQDDGGLPWEAEGLKSGTYQVKVTRAGYGADEKSVEVKPGDAATLGVKLEKGGGGTGANWVRIPGGTFKMGEGESENVTTVTLSPYAMNRTEVSVAQYKACVDAGKCSASEIQHEGSGWRQWCNWGVPGKENHPINCVDWNQATAYCEAQGGRLPTEAEWEFAARGTEGRKYPWGNSEPDAESKALFGKTDRGTAPVESYGGGVSPFGLLNMAGNVWEWVEDMYAPYPGGTQNNWKGEAGQQRVFRGGGWYGDADGMRAANRSKLSPAVRVNGLGFRCARGAVP